MRRTLGRRRKRKTHKRNIHKRNIHKRKTHKRKTRKRKTRRKKIKRGGGGVASRMKNLVVPRQGANLQEQRIIYVDRCGQGFSGLEPTDHPSCAGPAEEASMNKHLRMCKTKNTFFMDQKDDGFTITMKCRDGPVKVLLEGTPTSKFDGGSKQLVVRSAHDKIEFSWKIPLLHQSKYQKSDATNGATP